MSGHIAKQSYVFAIQDVFILTSALILLALIPAVFLRKKKTLSVSSAL
jgi:hypothetical protein